MYRIIIFHFTGSTIYPGRSFDQLMSQRAGSHSSGEFFAIRTASATYPVIVPTEKKGALLRLLNSDGSTIPSDPALFRIWKFWFIEPGLRPYF
jgi:hypothetical protein